MKKTNLIIGTVSGVALIAIIAFLIFRLNDIKKDYSDNKRLYCAAGEKNNKFEYYFDFKDGKLYKYTQILTNEPISAEDLDAMNKHIINSNNKYKGFTSKVWQNESERLIIDIYDLENLSDSERKELLIPFINDSGLMSRSEIIDVMNDKTVTFGAEGFACK